MDGWKAVLATGHSMTLQSHGCAALFLGGSDSVRSQEVSEVIGEKLGSAPESAN